MLHYSEAAQKARLSPVQTKRYLEYMRTRWPDSEREKCLNGCASEWANCFWFGVEYAHSDCEGERILDQIDQVDN